MTVYTQYTNATNLNNLLEGLLPYLTINPDLFLRDYFDLSTADDNGLDNWGRILQVQRSFDIPDYSGSIVGFDTGIPPSPLTTGYPQNFNNGNFYGGQTTPYTLDTDEWRFLLQLRYNALNTNCSMESCNAILNIYFRQLNPLQEVTVSDDGVMQMKISFSESLENYQYFLLRYYPRVLPIPAGVKYTVVQPF